MTIHKGNRGGANIAISAMFIAPLFAIYLFATATAKNVWFFGQETHIGCWFGYYFGIPCPVCGMPRSVILTVHGDLETAVEMHIGGPLFGFGSLLFDILIFY